MYFNFKRTLVLGLFIFSQLTVFGQETEKRLSISYERTDSTLVVFANSTVLFPQTATIVFDVKGLVPIQKLKAYYIIAPMTSKQELVVFSIPEGRSWDFSYTYKYYSGDLNATHDSTYVYRIPIGSKKSYPLTQGYNGMATHQGKNALDFTMPEGTEIFAAREGLVVGIKEDSSIGCPSKSCASQGNYVRIMHSDGTFADYYHLQFEGALVEKGQQVEKGQLIALSGYTGWATGAHLHFVVYKYSLGKQVTYKTLFQVTKRKSGYLREGSYYKAIAPKQ